MILGCVMSHVLARGRSTAHATAVTSCFIVRFMLNEFDECGELFDDGRVQTGILTCLCFLTPAPPVELEGDAREVGQLSMTNRFKRC